MAAEGLLVLFDVDGTLFLTSDLPPDAIGKVDHPGQTAQRITRLVLEAAGVDDTHIDSALARWCELVSDRYLELLAQADTSGWKAGSGAPETLEALMAAGAAVALLTGNPEPIARARMEILGLDRFFPPGRGAFGCDAEDRIDLIAIARRRAGDWPVERTWAVGDTPRDVEGAHDARIRCVGITSGRFDAEALADAEVVIERLPELHQAISA